MWFGMHKGSVFEELDDGYVMYLVNCFYNDGNNAILNVRYHRVWENKCQLTKNVMSIQKFEELYDEHDVWLVTEKCANGKVLGRF